MRDAIQVGHTLLEGGQQAVGRLAKGLLVAGERSPSRLCLKELRGGARHLSLKAATVWDGAQRAARPRDQWMFGTQLMHGQVQQEAEIFLAQRARCDGRIPVVVELLAQKVSHSVSTRSTAGWGATQRFLQQNCRWTGMGAQQKTVQKDAQEAIAKRRERPLCLEGVVLSAIGQTEKIASLAVVLSRVHGTVGREQIVVETTNLFTALRTVQLFGRTTTLIYIILMTFRTSIPTTTHHFIHGHDCVSWLSR
mmetsp:Transcript_679/g.2095  ORF Transcript_679/g.2095 Transcript_679/m.2095 type:complete len:251 (+) Transcript_679:364-1116(+)